MISVEAWRMSIGSYNRHKITDTSTLTKNSTNCATCLALMMTLTIMASALINTLLVIGGVEANPGPQQGNKITSSRIITFKIFELHLNTKMYKNINAPLA